MINVLTGRSHSPGMSRDFIKNYTVAELEEFFLSIGEKRYRSRQLFNWMYERNIDSFDLMTDFSKELRRNLQEKFILMPLVLSERLISGIDGTEKFLFKTMDGHYIESVLIKNDGSDDGRLTVCISSQAGCAMGCLFCETAKQGFHRNLETAEILEQLCQVRRLTCVRNNNVVFMGMGEPFMNYENVLKSADIMNYSFGFHISVRKITISTSGITSAIERFIDEKRPYNLAISLNDTEPEKRIKNMPVEKKFPFQRIASMLGKKFPASRNRLTIEYVMRKDNISENDAKRLKNIFRYSRIKLNLITLNTGSHNFEIPGQEEIDSFIRMLEIMNVPITVRNSFGQDISGACGQLSGRMKNYSSD